MQVVKQIKAIYGDKVQWIYKDYPLKRHKEAFKAAEASHCAEDQGKFWEYQESLFTTPDLSPPNIVNNAVKLGMSEERFSKCLQDERYNALVEKTSGRCSGGNRQDPHIYHQREPICRWPVAG